MNKNDKSVRMAYTAELVRAQLEGRVPAPVPDGITLDELEQIAHESHMDYLLLGALIKLPLAQERVENYRSYLKASTLKTLCQVQSARELQAAFEQAGIRNQVLKGSVMKHVYPRPELREMSDIDVMIYEDDFTDAERIIEERGYQKLQAIKHHVIFQKAPFLIFEMHWDLYEKTVDQEQYLYYKDHFRAVLKEGCRYTYEFSKEDFYVYMISHMAKHFYENGCGIRNLVDIYVYRSRYGSELDWDRVDAELRKCGICDFERHMAKLAQIWLGDGETDAFYNHLFEYMVDCGIYGKGENGIWAQLSKQEAASRARFYFPSAAYLEEYYPWLEGRHYLLPFAWLHRGFNGLRKRGAADRVKELRDTAKYHEMMDIYKHLNLKFVKH